MSKRQFKSQASSGRIGAGSGFGSSGFGSTHSSALSYIQEPPDYSAISDANLVVAFKNLQKKDSTTKAKALDDLQILLTDSGAETEVQETIVEAWVSIYPRLSIENARRVRQLAHSLNGKLCAKCGKRIAKHLSRLAGPWLAGTHDSDRAAAKAAQEAIATVFPDAEKVTNLRKTFQESILSYCRDALLDETVQTLSDERSVTAEDAASVYARVVSGCLATISELLDNLSDDQISKQMWLYEQLFTEQKLWDFAWYSDATVRRATHRLVQKCISKRPSLVQDNLKAISHAYVYKGLSSDQTGSAVDYAQTLASLTKHFPTIWTDEYRAKKSAASRLRQFLHNGSYSGTPAFWDCVRVLLSAIPDRVLPQTYEEVVEILSAARDGIARREERFNASAAWPAYFSLVDILSLKLSEDDCASILDGYAMPPVNQYLHPSDDSKIWTIGGAKPASIVSQVLLVRRIVPSLERKWHHLALQIVDLAKMSQPESSKDFDKSQKHVAAAGERWSGLQRDLWNHNRDLPESLLAMFANTNTEILAGCVDLLKTRTGKPYGAAAIVEEQLRACGAHLLKHQDYKSQLIKFVCNDIPTLITSPSQRHLGRCIFAVSAEPEFNDALTNTLQAILKADNSNEFKLKATHSLFSLASPKPAITIARDSASLQDFLTSQAAASGANESTGIFSDLLKAGVVSRETTDKVLAHLVDEMLISGPKLQPSLAAIDHLSQSNRAEIDAFMINTEGAGGQLIPTLLRLEQSQDETIADMAAVVSSRLTSSMGESDSDARYSVITQNLNPAHKSPLPIESLLNLVESVLEGGPQTKIILQLLPSFEDFLSSIVATMEAPKVSLGLLSPLGGAVHFVSTIQDRHGTTPRYDSVGLSPALRIALFLVKLLRRMDSGQSGDLEPNLMALLAICVLIAEDNISILGTNHMWRQTVPLDLVDFVSDADGLLQKYCDGHAEAFLAAFGGNGLLDSHHNSTLAYYSALASAKHRDQMFELHGYSTRETKAAEEAFKSARVGKDSLHLVSCIVGFAEPLKGSASLTRVCNELIANLTYSSAEQNDQRAALENLVILNAILHTQEDAVTTVAKQRATLFVKHLTSWLESESVLSLKAEVCKTLLSILPAVEDMYGTHWEQMIDFLISFWTSTATGLHDEADAEASILLTHASLKLYAALEKMSKSQDANDDLKDALGEKKDKMDKALIGLLISAGGLSDENHQPLKSTNELLGRQIPQLPRNSFTESADLYPLLYTPSRPIQGAAFHLLHQHIPAAQEQISFDAALDNKSASLPDELLSLIIDAPTLDSLGDATFDGFMPLSLQGYLFSWRLVFDHFNGSSFRVKTDYVEQLKEGGYLNGLLSLTFDFLGHTRGRPVDVSKFDIQGYVPDSEPNPEKDIQWLLTHLYFHALLNLPSLVKSFFLDIRSRQTSQAVESWTSKYISPLIISTNLETVAEWAQTSVKEDPDYSAMTVKVGMRSREINVSYEVDEQTMAIRVTLPEAYPLASAQVTSVNRVAVKEDKWQSWLRNCQGVITFSNGSITDGLSAWRRNVIGALKGQTECAICYSIISADKQLPTKRCPTCKNLFHSSCLFKWFKTSNSSTCPLCRNAFNFN